jgi:DNA-binding NtrC family response regulator
MPVYRKFEYRCFTCKPLRQSTAEKKEGSFKKTVLLHACHTPKLPTPITQELPAPQQKTLQAIRQERSMPEHHPIVRLWEHQDLSLATMEKNHICRVLDLCHGSKCQASQILGISVKTLYNKLTEWGMHIPHEGMVQ